MIRLTWFLILLGLVCSGCSTESNVKYRFCDSPSGAALQLGSKWKIVLEGVSVSGTDSHGSITVSGIGQQQGTLKIGKTVFDLSYAMGKAVLVLNDHRFEIIDGGQTLCFAGKQYESNGATMTELLLHADVSVTTKEPPTD